MFMMMMRRITRIATSRKANSRHTHDNITIAASSFKLVVVHRRFYQELAYETTGPIVTDVLRYNHCDNSASPTLSSSSSSSSPSLLVEVEMLYAPWNPADLNTVQGVYPISLPPQVQDLRKSRHFPTCTVAGSEGLGRVKAVHSAATATATSPMLQPGDYVTLAHPSLGTMRSSLLCPSDMLIRIARGDELVKHHHDTVIRSSSIVAAAAAASSSTLFQLGGTALRMLSDFEDLTQPQQQQHPHILLQNAGNSGVGFLVSQIAATLFPQVPVVSLVRRGSRSKEEILALKEHLLTQGRNTLVAVEEDLIDNKTAIAALTEQLRELVQDQPPRVLALNAVGGSSCGLLLKLMAGLSPSAAGGGGGTSSSGGTLVTYGGMSRKPVTVSTAQLIFQDVTLRGYWQARWMMSQQQSSKTTMMNRLVDLVLDHGVTCPPAQVFALHEYEQALAFDAQQSSHAIRSKVVFACQEE